MFPIGKTPGNPSRMLLWWTNPSNRYTWLSLLCKWFYFWNMNNVFIIGSNWSSLNAPKSIQVEKINIFNINLRAQVFFTYSKTQYLSRLPVYLIFFIKLEISKSSEIQRTSTLLELFWWFHRSKHSCVSTTNFFKFNLNLLNLNFLQGTVLYKIKIKRRSKSFSRMLHSMLYFF